MITTRRIRVLAAAAAILILFPPPASAQLLQKLMTQVTSVVGSITCAPVVSSPKIDDGIRTWPQSDGANDVPIIVTSGTGLLSAVQSLVTRVTGTLQLLDGIDALAARVTSSQPATLACDPNVASISLDATVKSFATAADDGQWRQTLLWSGDSTWGQHVVWGTSDPVWGSHIVWGTGYAGSTDGQHVVWGTTGGPDGTVWGNVAPVADGKGSPPEGN
jgi:hypothetical protein